MIKNEFIILYGGCGRAGTKAIDYFIEKKIYILNLDPNHNNYHDKENDLYQGFDNTNFLECIPKLKLKLLNLLKLRKYYENQRILHSKLY